MRGESQQKQNVSNKQKKNLLYYIKYNMEHIFFIFILVIYLCAIFLSLTPCHSTKHNFYVLLYAILLLNI